MYELQKKIKVIVVLARYSYLLKVLNCILVHTINTQEIPIVLSMAESIISLFGVMFFQKYNVISHLHPHFPSPIGWSLSYGNILIIQLVKLSNFPVQIIANILYEISYHFHLLQNSQCVRKKIMH